MPLSEGFEDIQTLKRYTTVTMGPCQGKMCHQASVSLCAAMTGHTPTVTGTTTARPPAVAGVAGTAGRSDSRRRPAFADAPPARGRQGHVDRYGRVETAARVLVDRIGMPDGSPACGHHRREHARQARREREGCCVLSRMDPPEPRRESQAWTDPLSSDARRSRDHRRRRDDRQTHRRSLLRDDRHGRARGRRATARLVARQTDLAASMSRTSLERSGPSTSPARSHEHCCCDADRRRSLTAKPFLTWGRPTAWWPVCRR